MIVDLFINILALSGTFCTGLGVLTLWYWLKTPDSPNDRSNRINNIQSWWIGLTRPEVLGKSYKHFQKDIMEQIENE